MNSATCFIALLLIFREIAYEAGRPSDIIYLEDKLQVAFLKNGSLYNIQRFGISLDMKTKPTFVKLRLYKSPINNMDLDKVRACFELKDGAIVINSGTFLRWRLTRSNYFWGTERGLDNDFTGIFRLPLRILKPLAIIGRKPQKFEEEHDELYNFVGGGTTIGDISSAYWADKNGPGIPATLRIDTMPKGSKGIYFDFVPLKKEQNIILFVLFDKYNLKFSEEKNNRFANRNVIDMWQCEKGSNDKPFKDGTFDGSESPMKEADITMAPVKDKEPPKDIKKGWISTDMSEPFYVFEKNDDYYFTTLSGKIFLAAHLSVDSKKIERLIAELDSDTFAIREKATLDLRPLGKPAQAPLETQLSKSTSQEQKRRIKQILGELKPLPDRETKLLWNDAKRPVDKLLFDLDKKKTYAFTKPNSDKQIYYFEITDKPQPRLFTGNTNPDAPAAVLASTRLFLEYARFVRKLK